MVVCRVNLRYLERSLKSVGMDARMDDGWLRIPTKSRSGKKQAKNPFYFFMQAKKKQWIAEGGHSLKRSNSSISLLIRSPCRNLGREKTDEKACGSLSPYLGSEQDQSHFPGSLHGGGEAVAVRTTYNDLEQTYDSLGGHLQPTPQPRVQVFY